MKGKKWRDVRNALVMVIVMVAMMSSATFAWFTLTNSPTVTGLQMTAAASAGLLVSNENDTSKFANAILIANDNDNGIDSSNPELLKLTPVTPNHKETSYGFSEAKYSGGVVTGLSDKILTGDDLKGKVAVYTYFIKAETEDVGVGLIMGDSEQTNSLTADGGVAGAAGTFIRQKTSQTATDELANYAVRIGLVVSGPNETPNIKNMIIVEPNTNGRQLGQGAGTKASVTGTDIDSEYDDNKKIVANKNGEITTGYLSATDKFTSEYLFTATSAVKKVTMYIWLEGSDSECVDEIRKDDIEGQIQFTTVPIPTP